MMPVNVDDDGSEDVTDFLKRIKELGDQRDREDEERTRKLEQEIIQGRKERQARRLERARSLSPSKDSLSNVGTPSSIRSKTSTSTMNNSANAPTFPPPQSAELSREDPPKAYAESIIAEPANSIEDTDFLEHKTESSISPFNPASNAVPARAGTLSWQQRPSNRLSASTRSRPQSKLAQDSNMAQNTLEKVETRQIGDENASRSSIAQSLEMKDPTWFRQTQERGKGSAAYRKNQEEAQPSVGSREPGIGLPGLSKENVVGTKKSPPSESVRSPSPATEKSSSTLVSSSTNSTLPSSSYLARSPLPTSSSQKLDPPPDTTSAVSDSQQPQGRNYAMSPSQRGLSPERMERPSSPTKGLGGFVQSAMMKRSDSMSKRWSAQPTPLGRADSVSSNRSAYEAVKTPFGGIGSLGEPRPAHLSRESTPAASTSRPSSSHSNATVTPRTNESSIPEASVSPRDTKADGPQSRPAKRTPPPSSGSRPSSKDSNVDTMTSPPTSPSKRWSPQKSSWLEKAINKPESPKILSPSQPSQQPSWMANIAKAKQQRGSIDLSKGPGHQEIVTVGLMRAPPPAAGFKPPSIGKHISDKGHTSARSFGSSEDLKKEQDSSKPVGYGLTTSKSLGQVAASGSPKLEGSPKLDRGSTLNDTDSSIDREVSSTAAAPLAVESKPILRPKPETPPKKDLVSGLRARPSSGEANKKDEPEFKNVFGKLKPTQTQRYKAPDELKDNITRGKAGLTFTGGPQKTEHKNEFKESILKKKQGMVAPSASTKISGAASKQPDPVLSEALRKRQGMKTAGSTTSDAATKAKESSSVEQPSALLVAPSIQGNACGAAKNEQAGTPTNARTKASDGLGINFTSSLSGILQRGPPKISSDNQEAKVSEPISLSTPRPALTSQPQEAAPEGPQLIHATKGRARGPKRKPPTANQQPSTSPVSPFKSSTSPTRTSQSPSIEKSDVPSHVASPKIEQRPLQNITNKDNINRRTSQPSSPRKPSTSIKPLPRIQPTTMQPPSATTAGIDSQPKPVISSKPSNLVEEKASSTIVTPKNANTEKAPLLTGRKTPTATLQQPRMPNSIEPTKSNPATPARKPQSPPLPQKPAFFASTTLAQDPISSPLSSALPAPRPHLDVAQLLLEIFDEPLNVRESIKIGTQSVLDSASSKESFPKIKTLRKQISEVQNNGKAVPVPSHQEHILFEDSLYLCMHVFGTPAGQRMTEVYLWCGDGASPSMIEDAQLFAKRYAKDHGGRLIVLQQGKETSSFFQALGGIFITRRGSSSRASASDSRYMLRGRQHIGQIAFDETDLSSLNLCSGFPHIISPGSGKLYLWKGQGASADEIGCARLIGMDLGEIVEIDEGQEPKVFWSAFPSPRPSPRSTSQYWHLKPSRDTYNLRLFGVETESPRPKSASSFMQWGRRGSAPSPDRNTVYNAHFREIVPFSHADLVDEGIVVLDAFFEVFVIHSLVSLSPPPHRRSHQYTPFRAALLFAQEYAILAASMEDRPFVPQAHVVLLSSSDGEGEVPEAVRCAFRKWDEKRVRGCRVLGLPEVLEAVGASREI